MRVPFHEALALEPLDDLLHSAVPKTKTKPMTRTKTKTGPRHRGPSYLLRRSPVHGNGLFATRAIKKGERIIEYVGEHISHEEADRRHQDKAIEHNHTIRF